MQSNVFLKMLISLAFEHEFPRNCIREIEETTIKSIPASISAFALVCEVKACTCTPKCSKEAIALLNGSSLCFVDSSNYDRIAECVATMLEMEAHHAK
jgi:hypothetical protein